MPSIDDYSPHEPMAEDGYNEPLGMGALASSSGELAEEYDLEDALLETIAKSERIEKMISAAMVGALPRSRPLKSWEPDKINPRHVSVIMLRAVGYRQNRISELTGFEPSTVSIILRHPDSQTILAAILSEGAKQAINISAQVKKEAPKMLKIVQEIANDRDVKPETRTRAAFGWLAMYERIEEREVAGGSGAEDKLSLNRDDASRLIAAIEESKRVKEVSFVLVPAPPKQDPNEILAPAAQVGSVLPGDALTPDAIRQWELEQALEQRIAESLPSGAEPTQGQGDGSELEGSTYSTHAGISRSTIPGRMAPNRTDRDIVPTSSAELSFSPPPSAVAVRNERQVSRSDVESVA